MGDRIVNALSLSASQIINDVEHADQGMDNVDTDQTSQESYRPFCRYVFLDGFSDSSPKTV